MNVIARPTKFVPIPGARRIFLVGCPRSGTTLLQSLFAAHSQLTSFPESHFFPNVIANSRWRRLTGAASKRARDRVITFLYDAGEQELANRLPRRMGSVRDCTRLFVGLLDYMAHGRQKNGWLEKTPRHLHFVNHIEALVPDSSVIHIVRDGADTIASLYNTTNRFPDRWGGARSLDACIDRWLSDIERSRSQIGRTGHAFIRYESLLRDPEVTLERACSRLGISFEPEMLAGHADAAAHLQHPWEEWKHETTQAIQRGGRRKFSAALTVEQQQQVLEKIAHVDLDRWFPAMP